MSRISAYEFKRISISQAGLDCLLESKEKQLVFVHSDHGMPYSEPERSFINIDVPRDQVHLLKLHDFYRINYTTFPLFLATIPNAVVFSPLMIIFSNDELLVESIPPWRRDNLFFYEKLANYVNCREIVEVDEPVCVLANYSHTNYWHWVTQCLVNIYLLKFCGIFDKVKFLIPLSDRSYVMETLKLLGIDSNRIISFGLKRVHIKNLIYPSFLEEHSNGRFSPLIMDVFNDLACGAKKALTCESVDVNERLYFTRLDTSARRILNEDQLVAALECEGFKAVTCSEYTVEQQIALASSAKLILSPHGAAMTNIGFMPRLGKVMEIFPERWGVSCFYSLTRMRHQKHYLFVERDIIDADKGHGMKMRVDIGSVLRSLSFFEKN